MRTMRRWGVGLTVLAAAVWLALTVTDLTMSPEDGANIGGGALFVLAVPLTVTGLALWIAGRGWTAGQAGAAGTPSAPLRGEAAGGRVQAVANPFPTLALVIGILSLALALAPIGNTEAQYFVLTGVALLLAVLAIGLGWWGIHRANRNMGESKGLALAGIIIGATAFGLNALLIPELFLFLTGNLQM